MPPPLAKAIGHELRKCLVAKQKTEDDPEKEQMMERQKKADVKDESTESEIKEEKMET